MKREEAPINRPFLYEHRKQELLPVSRFLLRVLRHGLIAAMVMSISLLAGILGYHLLAGLGWVDSFLNASMILGGMGPVDALKTPGAKVFAGLYALFSGVVFIGIAGMVIAPFAHRLIHKFHLDK